MNKGGQIKKEDIELYRFYFSGDNKNPGVVNARTRTILRYRFEDQMAYAKIAELMGMTPARVRTEFRLFKRKALIAKWYTQKKEELENDSNQSRR